MPSVDSAWHRAPWDRALRQCGHGARGEERAEAHPSGGRRLPTPPTPTHPSGTRRGRRSWVRGALATLGAGGWTDPAGAGEGPCAAAEAAGRELRGASPGRGSSPLPGAGGGLQPPRWVAGALDAGSFISLRAASLGRGCSSSGGSQVAQPRHGQDEGLVLGERLSLPPWGGGVPPALPGSWPHSRRHRPLGSRAGAGCRPAWCGWTAWRCAPRAHPLLVGQESSLSYLVAAVTSWRPRPGGPGGGCRAGGWLWGWPVWLRVPQGCRGMPAYGAVRWAWGIGGVPGEPGQG